MVAASSFDGRFLRIKSIAHQMGMFGMKKKGPDRELNPGPRPLKVNPKGESYY
jgi:hypothetical protein